MASIYKRKSSKYWWLKYLDGDRVIRKSTKLRHSVTAETRKAQALMHEWSARELTEARCDQDSRWDAWVQSYLDLRYSTSPKTHRRYSNNWRNLLAYFDLNNIRFPHELKRSHCFDYMPWRKGRIQKNGTYKICHNTARMELKLLHLVLDEAVRRGFTTQNVASKLGLKREKPAEKPEFRPEHVALIRQELLREPEWMSVAFEIGFRTGLRLRETDLQLDLVDLERRIFCVLDPKGGRAFSAPFDPDLLPLFEKLIEERGRHARCYDMPQLPSKEFWFFFRRIKLPQYCFHCTRVSFITRGARQGIPERIMQRLVNHADRTIHSIYLRLGVEDAAQFMDQIQAANRAGANEPS